MDLSKIVLKSRRVLQRPNLKKKRINGLVNRRKPSWNGAFEKDQFASRLQRSEDHGQNTRKIIIALPNVVPNHVMQAVDSDDGVEPISIFQIENVHRSPLYFWIAPSKRFLNKNINGLDVWDAIDRKNESAP